MNKQAYLEEIYNSAFNDELEKISKLRIGDLEDELGHYLSDEQEDVARDLIKKRNSK